jgi:hypothetical protein
MPFVSQWNSTRSLKLVLNDNPTSMGSYFGIVRILLAGMPSIKANTAAKMALAGHVSRKVMERYSHA